MMTCGEAPRPASCAVRALPQAVGSAARRQTGRRRPLGELNAERLGRVGLAVAPDQAGEVVERSCKFRRDRNIDAVAALARLILMRPAFTARGGFERELEYQPRLAAERPVRAVLRNSLVAPHPAR